jgi:hypothetical protein
MTGFVSASNNMYTLLHPGWHMFQKDMDVPGNMTSQLWVFMDETMYTLNDGYLQCDLDGFAYPDCPAAYDFGGNCISFYDGHAEYHKWQQNPKVSPGQIIGIKAAPYAMDNFRNPGPTVQPAGAVDPDYKWMQSHTSYK